MIQKEKTVHVQTKKITGYDNDGESMVETLVIKLRTNGNNGPFEEFLKVIHNNKYKSLTVVGVYSPAYVDESGKKVEDKLSTEGVEAFQKLINEVKNPVKATKVDYKALSEKQSDMMSEMMERLEALEGKNKDAYNQSYSTESGGTESLIMIQADEETKKELRDEILSLGGKVQGLKSVEGLEKRLKELKG